ncbi:MAG TPA: nitroreductase family protein [Longimicrobiales bacterium]|nr:nitroreductase family protein [Longimicrobiales bacterium]
MSTVETHEAHPREKYADTTVPVTPEIRRRWSPRAFDDRVVSDDDLRVLLEAARWAPSSYNEQPWRFIVARRENEEQFEQLLGCLTPKNQEWARKAPILLLTVASRVFHRNGKPNRHAFHDVGLAMGNLLNQASAMGIYVHQMAGIDPDRARDRYRVPEEFDVVAGVAVGYLGDPEELDDSSRRESETRERSRRGLEELVFQETWGRPAADIVAATVTS